MANDAVLTVISRDGLQCRVTANRASGCALSLPIIQSRGTGSVTAERMEGEVIALTQLSASQLNCKRTNTHTTVSFLWVTTATEGAGSRGVKRLWLNISDLKWSSLSWWNHAKHVSCCRGQQKCLLCLCSTSVFVWLLCVAAAARFDDGLQNQARPQESLLEQETYQRSNLTS